MIDSHCHLEFRHFDKNREKVIRESKKRIKGIIDSCARIKTADMVLELHEKHPKFIFPSLGLHPKQAVKVSETEVDEYKGFIEKNRKKHSRGRRGGSRLLSCQKTKRKAEK
ncbi:hypothetical protein AKJ38_01280 [candidate division MSBL1 archaeon SCGC-AAA259I14]|uniref:Uncharacterized protein n=1 Tax=candidate division MSBL1 archaeon SCGC-AAA259I14 TaxID=1698268 RepID=A0A133UT64_9EURY|nr:hypothetical protein AKJ38_01280 [candidate division MSBL1 archaeon SCGC-AAA259I14]